ncbi:MAG: NIPSNAP family protein [Paracoccaceae bacterium]|nr:NIPSNAP family protein [Paracoccaceae bacterium]
MPLYEKRTYSVTTGKMPEVIKLYQEIAWPVMEGEGFAPYLIGYFISDTGPLHQLIHLWRFEDDADRRAFWKRLYGSENFMRFAVQVRPLLQGQEVQLMMGAPWGPNP